MPRAEQGQVVKVDKASGHSRFRIRQGEPVKKALERSAWGRGEGQARGSPAPGSPRMSWGPEARGAWTLGLRMWGDLLESAL